MARLTELANEASLGRTGSPLSVGHTTLVIDVETESLVPLTELVEATLVLVDKVEGLLVSRIAVADGRGEGLEPDCELHTLLHHALPARGIERRSSTHQGSVWMTPVPNVSTLEGRWCLV